MIQRQLKEEKHTLANVYAPNKNQDAFLKIVLEELYKLRTGHAIVAGDCNMTMELKVRQIYFKKIR